MDLLAVFILIVSSVFYVGAVVPTMGGWSPNGNGLGYAEGFKYGVLVHLVLAALIVIVATVAWAAVTVFQ